MGLMLQKQNKFPKTVVREIKFTAADLYKTFLLHHLREDGNGLVCAEGIGTAYTLANEISALYAVDNSIFAFALKNKLLYELNNTKNRFVGFDMPTRIVSYREKNNLTPVWFCISNASVYHIHSNITSTRGTDKGGDCAAIFKERLFTAKEYTIRFSIPLDPHKYTESRYGGGSMEIPSEEGYFIDAVAFRDQLYFFRERGIMLLRALGDDLNFKAIPIKFGGGTIAPGTVADCGDRILFFASQGLYSFNGGVAKRVEDCLFEQIEGTPTCGGSYKGNYYAVCTHRTFGKCIYCYEPQTGRAHFIFVEPQLLAAKGGVWFSRGKQMFELTEKGYPYSGGLRLVRELSDFGLGSGEKLLDAVTIEGEGEFGVNARSEYGVSSMVFGTAGGKLRFPASVRGSKFALEINCYGTDIRVKSVTLHFSEVQNGN